MAEIAATQVKALRDRTGAGMMDCKKALVACEGDMEQAIDWLRKKGLSLAAKKAGRVACDGLIGVCVDGNKGTLVEVNAETDFVARNDLFQKFVTNVTQIAESKNLSIESLKNEQYPETGRTVAEELTNLVATVGENMELRRVAHLSVSDGVVASYMHNKISDNLGRLGVLVALESTADKSKLLEFGKKIAMHIAAAAPKSVDVEDLDPTLVARERDIVTEQARNSGKKEEFIGKIVEGRLSKFYGEVVLMEQIFVMDGSTKIKDVIANTEKELGAPIKITKFEKFVLGEGIEKQTVDFAAEVAAQLS